MFVGFDIAEIQPRLREYENFFDLADRISWVNGNLYVLTTPSPLLLQLSVAELGTIV